MAQIVWTEPAVADLDAIADYIALQDPAAAKAFVQRIIRHIRQLADYLESGSRPKELGRRTRYRQIVEPPCRIFYRYDGERYSSFTPCEPNACCDEVHSSAKSRNPERASAASGNLFAWQPCRSRRVHLTATRPHPDHPLVMPNSGDSLGWFDMKTVYGLAAIFLGMTTSSEASESLVPTCPTELQPASIVAVELPPRLHNEFIGHAEVAMVIGPDGDVQSPSIVTEEWRPVGRSRGQPIGYHEAILSAVAQWRFPPREDACRHRMPIGFSWQG